MKLFNLILLTILTGLCLSCNPPESGRIVTSFNEEWEFFPGDLATDSLERPVEWRTLNLPHDWSIEGSFSKSHPATEGGGALPGGIGWYKKTFSLDESQKEKAVYIQFDGVYMNSEVWINDHYLGKRPFGYISFQYDLTPHLNFGEQSNELKVRVDNSQQPNSRWYSGSGIYRNVRLVLTEPVHVSQWGTYITSTKADFDNFEVSIATNITNRQESEVTGTLVTRLLEGEKEIERLKTDIRLSANGSTDITQAATVQNPRLWDLEKPFLYTAVSEVYVNDRLTDTYTTTFGIRDFKFDVTDGFILNGRAVKIRGVCNHHDLGSLGAAVNRRAIQRQLEILQEMGVNAIRTAHNPPAPELLDLCDEMGFIVMDEAFDIWKKKKSPYDYSLYWDEWHERDLTDFIKRDRNHPSVFIWSIGNEIIDQWDSTGAPIARELAGIVRSLDSTRPITAAMNPPGNFNSIATSGALDLIGYNYHHEQYKDHRQKFPDLPFIATETTSALATRGYYDVESDTLKRWPIRWDLPFDGGNPGNTVSAYDQVSTPWGSTHEESWRAIKDADFLSGMFIWTGFDYLGEPTPYSWPSRSSYFGVIDLAGFPKDAYYMYQSEWTGQDVLHIFPHWNWEGRDSVDVWAYTNAGEVELFLNGTSLGTKQKGPEDLHLMWRVAYTPGTVKAISRTDGMDLMTKTMQTADEPARLELVADRSDLIADGTDLSFVTVRVLDANGIPVPDADNLIRFSVKGPGEILSVDNGNPVSHEPFKAAFRNAFNGLALVVVQTGKAGGAITLTATSDGLTEAAITLQSGEAGTGNVLADFFGL